MNHAVFYLKGVDVILEKYLQEYRRLGLTIQQIEQVKIGFEHGLTTTQVDVYAKPRFDSLQMEEIRLAFEDGLTFEDVDKFAKVEFGHEQMNHVRIKIRNEKKLEENRNADLAKKHLKNLILLGSLIFIIIVIGLVSLFAREEISLYFQKIELTLTDKEITLNYNEPFIAMNYVKSYSEEDNIELILPEDIRTDIIGKQKVLYKIKNEKKVISKILILNVVDLEAPTITLKENSITLIRNKDKFSCRSYIENCIDNVDGDLTASIICSDEIDKSLDSQLVNYEVVDKSGNKATKELELILKNEEKPVIKEIKTNSNSNNTNNNQTPAYTEPTVPQNNSNSGGTVTYDSGWIYETIDGIDGSGNAIVEWE